MADFESMYFESPTGAIRPLDNLTGAGVFIMWGMSGRFMPGFTFDTQDLGLLEGAEIVGVKVEPRVLQVPVRIEGLTSNHFEDVMSDLSFEFAPTEGDGRLYTTTKNDKSFYLICRYSKGMEISEESEFGAQGYNAVLEFFAADPYWYLSGPPLSASAQAATTGRDFFSDPWFPVEFGSSQVLDNFEIFNPGAPNWPIITVTGPSDSLSVRNKLTGETIWIDEPITAGQILIIDTRPKRKTITINGASAYSARRTGSVMFPLSRGINQLRVELENADENSGITVDLFPRFWVPR